jgi:hypothetical protein
MNRFVLVATGRKHVEQANTCLSYLKQYTRTEIVVITTEDNVNHDNVLVVKGPSSHPGQINRFIKTSLYKYVDADGLCCYLDNDVYAVHPDIDLIFDQFESPMTFATDHVSTVQSFSRWALKKGDLREEISKLFDVDVENEWRLWNGGVFLFNQDAVEVMQSWHDFTTSIFDNPNWNLRDQATLAAAVWKHGLQDHKRLPVEFNWIVQHSGLASAHPTAEFDGKVFKNNEKTLKLLHFIHKGKGDDAEEFRHLQQLGAHDV